jgi:hypothetical protein
MIYDAPGPASPTSKPSPKSIDIVLSSHGGRIARGGHSLDSSLLRDLHSSGFFAEVAQAPILGG